MKRTKQSKSGFTLIELMVVVIIVGILAAVMVPMMSANKTKAQSSEALAAIGSINSAARLYMVETDSEPDDLDALTGAGLLNQDDLNGTYFTGYACDDFSADGVAETVTATGPGGTWTFEWNDDTDSYKSTVAAAEG